jgi:hypothetical protein
VKASLRGDARTYVTGPLITGADAPERLSALRFPLLLEGKIANLGGILPREKECACVIVGWAKARSAVPTWALQQS